MSIYTGNTVIAALAVSLLFYAAIFQLSDGIQICSAGILRGYKDTVVPMFINIVSYWMIGLVLSVSALAEVAIFYIPGTGAALAPTLLILSAVKFSLVVMFFMHLRFDSKIFSGVFLAGLALAIFVVSALFVLYQVLPSYRV